MQKFKKLDHFQILQIIGKGANGLVYKGLNTMNGSIVAIKQIVIGKSEVKAIKTQLNLLKQLEHPCIVKYIDAIQKQNKIYLILQYMEGGSLGALVRKSPLQQQVAKIYIKQVLKGLVFLHKEQVIHRDIKGANILLTKNGLVKLADFGVALRLEDSQKTISAAGSPYWMAPEIISSQAQPTTKCDIWSLGCTLIQLLTGNPPYFQLMQFPALFRIVQDKHPSIPPCSAQCKQLLLACFTKDPKQRPSASELLNYNWLNSAKDHQINTIKSQQQTITKQLTKYLYPIINYQQLQRILKQNKNCFLICKHKYFQSIIMDTKNNLRLPFLINLMKNDQTVVDLLHRSGIFFQQLQKIKQKYQFNQESITMIYHLNNTLIQIYQRKINQCQTTHTTCQMNPQSFFSSLQSIIIQHCIPMTSKILSSLLKQRKNQLKDNMILVLHKFISVFLSKRNKDTEKQLLLQIVSNLQEWGGLKQLINLNFCEQKGSEYNVYISKLDLILKLSPGLVFLGELKSSFRKYIMLLLTQLSQGGFSNLTQTIITIKFMCINELILKDKYKHILQKNGFIYYISQYYENISQETKQINYVIIYESIICLNKFFINDYNGIDKNRITQFNKYLGNIYLQTIYSKIYNQTKNGKKQINSSALFQKIKNIITILQNYYN